MSDHEIPVFSRVNGRLRNRSFWTAATSSGLVVNSPMSKWFTKNNAETIFERLEAHGRTWKVYVMEPMPLSFTGVIHFPRLKDRLATHFVPFAEFEADAAAGTLCDATAGRNLNQRPRSHEHSDVRLPVSGGPARLADLGVGLGERRRRLAQSPVPMSLVSTPEPPRRVSAPVSLWHRVSEEHQLLVRSGRDPAE